MIDRTKKLAVTLQGAADALMAAAVNYDCPRCREAAQEADRTLESLGFSHPDPSATPSEAEGGRS